MSEIGFSRRGYSSGVEHSTADREVPGSIPGVPLIFLRDFNWLLFSIILDKSLFKWSWSE